MKNEAQRGGVSCPRSHSWCVAKPKATRRHVAACRVLAPPPHSLVLVTGVSESAATPAPRRPPARPGEEEPEPQERSCLGSNTARKRLRLPLVSQGT